MEKLQLRLTLTLIILTSLLLSPVQAFRLAVDENGLPIKPMEDSFTDFNLEKLDPLLKNILSQDKVRVLIELTRKEVKLPSYVKVLNRFKLIPIVSAEVPRDALTNLSKVKGVKLYLDNLLRVQWLTQGLEGSFLKPFRGKVFPNGYPALLNETSKLIGAERLWRMNFTGRGVIVAVLDTGINKNHPSLDDLDDDPLTMDLKVIGEVSFVPGENASDGHGHGTYVASIIAGTGFPGSKGFKSTFYGEFKEGVILPKSQVGVAPEAYLLNVKVLSNRGYGYESWVISGIEWAISHGADVISMSLGGLVLEPQSPLCKAIKRAVDMGVTVIVACGNSGPGLFSVSDPGNAVEAITVGAVYETGELTWFSGRGPTPIYLNPKPDVLAPGAAIIGANAFYVDDETFYISAWGTSPATAVVAGASALLIQAFPGITPEAVKIALMKTARDIGLDYNSQGAGIINVSAAYDLINSSKKVSGELLIDEHDLTPTSFKTLFNKSILFIGEQGRYEKFLDLLRSEGAKIHFENKSQPINLTEFNALIIHCSNKSRLVNLTANALEFFLSGGGILFIGGEKIDAYKEFTKKFLVDWMPLGASIGGYTEKIVNHPATIGVREVYLPNPLTSLKPLSEEVKTIVYDYNFSSITAWSSFRGGRIVIVSDEQLFSNKYIERADNAKLGLSIVKWITGFKKKIMHEVAIGLKHLRYVYNGSVLNLTITLRNFGDCFEQPIINLSIVNEDGERVESWSGNVSVAARQSKSIKLKLQLISRKPLETFTINASLIIDKDYDPTNNNVSSRIPVVSKIIRSGVKPVFFYIHPSKIDSLSSPLISMYPGDFKLINLTLFSSVKLSEAYLKILGNLSEVASFSNATKLTVENIVTNYLFNLAAYEPVPKAFNYGVSFREGVEVEVKDVNRFAKTIQIIVPELIEERVYSGRIVLRIFDKDLDLCVIKIVARKPLGKILFDDIFDYFYPFYNCSIDAEKLWGSHSILTVYPSLFDWWRIISEEGFDVDSMNQYMYDRGISDPWTVFLSGEYKAIIIHDKDAHRYELSIWPEILKKGVSILTLFDGGFDGLYTSILPKVFPERFMSYVLVQPINLTHPLTKGVGKVFMIGGYSLMVSEEATPLATGIDLYYGESVSGAVLATYRHPSQAKQVAYGDSNIFEYISCRDLLTLIFTQYFNVSLEEETLREFAVNLVRYVLDEPPVINVTPITHEFNYLGEASFRIHVTEPVTGYLKILDEFNREVYINALNTSNSINYVVKLSGRVKPGDYNVVVEAWDKFGNKGVGKSKFRVVDLNPPVLKLIQPRNNSLIKGLINVLFQIDELMLKEVRVKLNDSMLYSSSRAGLHGFTIDSRLLPDGVYVIKIYAVDHSGNSVMASIKVIIDNEPPKIKIISPLNNSDYSTSTVKVEWVSCNEATSTLSYYVKIDDGDWVKVNGENSFIFNGLSYGVHVVYVLAVDELGNYRLKSVTFTIGKENAFKLIKDLAKKLKPRIYINPQAEKLIKLAFERYGSALSKVLNGEFNVNEEYVEALNLLVKAESIEQNYRYALILAASSTLFTLTLLIIATRARFRGK